MSSSVDTGQTTPSGNESAKSTGTGSVENGAKEKLREQMPKCYEIVQAFKPFGLRVIRMREGDVVWERK